MRPVRRGPMNVRRVLAAVVLAGSVLSGCGTTAGPVAVPSFGLPCVADDGTGPRPCFWDAGVQGDGRGRSFFVTASGDLYTLAPPAGSQ